MKLWWNFPTLESLWAQFMRLKYYYNGHPADVYISEGFCYMAKTSKSEGDYWSRIIWNGLWPGRGNINFWKDSWLDTGNCVILLISPMLIIICPCVILLRILSIGDKYALILIVLYGFRLIRFLFSWMRMLIYRGIWQCSSDGNFSIKTGWEVSRSQGTYLSINSFIWHIQFGSLF